MSEISDNDFWELSEEETEELIELDRQQNREDSKYKDQVPKNPIPLHSNTQNTKKEEKQEKKALPITPLTLLAARMRKECTEELVNQIKTKYRIFTTRDDEKSECWIYIDGIYLPNARTYIQEHIREELGDAFTTHICNEVIDKIEADTYIIQENFFQNQDKYPYLLPLQNGIIDINTKKLYPFTTEIYFFNKLPINYNPDATCPHIEQFLSEVLINTDDKKTLLEFFGSCLLKEYKYEKMVMLIGKGRNGKGKTLELLKRMLGIENCAELSPQLIEESDFAMGELFGKMANISGDINSATLKNTGKIKTLSGRDLVMANRKFRTMIKFVNYAKFIFSANEIPDTKDLTDGFFSRWIVIDFPYQFLSEKDINDKTEEEKKYIKLQDPNIIEKITTQDELDGLFNLCLNSYHDLKERTYFTGNQTIDYIRKTWMQKSNSVRAFVMECCEEDYDSQIEKSQFKMYYVAYCRRHSLKQLGDKEILSTLTSNYNVSTERTMDNLERNYVWKGIKLKNNFGIEEK